MDNACSPAQLALTYQLESAFLVLQVATHVSAVLAALYVCLAIVFTPMELYQHVLQFALQVTTQPQ